MNALAIMFLLSLAGGPLAYRLAGPRAQAVPLAPLLGAGYLAAGATVQVAIGGPPLGDALVALAGGVILPMIGPISASVTARRVNRPSVQGQEFVLLLVPSLLFGWALYTLKRTHVGWDGRSIWFFHARMLLGGRDVFLAQAHAFPFSHPDYPPMVSAALSFGWSVNGSIDYRQGQLVVAALTACATVLVSVALATALTASRWLAPIVTTVCVALCYGVWDEYASNGYVDPLSAALVLAAAIYGLLAPPGVDRVRLAIALSVLASVVKNEALVYSLIVLVFMAVAQLLTWRRESWSSALLRPRWFVLGFALMLTWPLVMRSQGLGGDQAPSPLQGQAADPLHRLGDVLDALGSTLGWALAGFMGLVIVSLMCPRDTRLRISSFLAVELGGAITLIMAYATGPFEIHWWIEHSFDRTNMVLRAGGLLAAVYAAFAAGALLLAHRSVSSYPSVIEGASTIRGDAHLVGVVMSKNRDRQQGSAGSHGPGSRWRAQEAGRCAESAGGLGHAWRPVVVAGVDDEIDPPPAAALTK